MKCEWVRHHGMTRLRVADAGDGLYIWRIIANIFTKKSWTPDGGDPAWGLGEGLTTPHRKEKIACYEISGRDLSCDAVYCGRIPTFQRAMLPQSLVFVVTPCSVVGYQRFRGLCCLSLQSSLL